ncbi:MAG TPA: ATPase, T2SS/T4P/T4SS family [Acidimicrobiales bacterium]|nr:ATPase, T2SS/T4P/T4SS family [Acidimicrobiales bacterium]
MGDVLVSRGVQADVVATALDHQSSSGGRLGEILMSKGQIRSQQLADALGSMFGFPAINLETLTPDSQVVNTLPEALARRLRALPIFMEDGKFVVAIDDPSNVVALDDIRTVLGAKVQFVVASPDQLQRTLDRAWQSELAQSPNGGSSAPATRDDDTVDLVSLVQDAPVVKLVNQLLTRAVRERASDIHFEATASGARVRFRIDGMLQDVANLAPDVVAPTVGRMKVMASLDISNRRLPQDGRLTFRHAGADVDMRVSTLPTVRGESVVLRLLDKSRGLLDIEDLGFLPDTLATFERSYRKSWGAVLVTGPTGSGKTTTLYAALAQLNRQERSIVTVEDPVEYEVEGIRQVQVADRTGLTFARALRAMLRCDPDVMLIGEMRDEESARIAAEASLTGHLVLSTLHTNDASSAPTRLAQMGLELFLIASSLECVVAQRLVRSLCLHCRQRFVPTAHELAAVGWPASGMTVPDHLYQAAGCADCRGSGFQGRFAIHEVMPLTPALRELILAGATADAVRRQAIEDGMRPMRADGLHKVAAGRTSLDELSRVVSALNEDDTTVPYPRTAA